MAERTSKSKPGSVADLQAFVDLRERTNLAIKEITRLRKENANLASQVKELEASGGSGLDLGADGETPEELKARIEGFIGAIDHVLAESAEAA